MQTQEQAGSWGQLFSGSNAIRTLTLVGGVALHAINVFISTTILPTVIQDIGGIDFYAWNTTLFVAASILGSMMAPRLLGQVGPRYAYLVAAVIFAIGTTLCAVAPSMPVMLFGRSVQGFGGGFLLALSFSMVRLVFEPRLWTFAIALISGMWGVASLVGPAIGGVFAQYGHWRMAFGSIIPVIVLFGLLALFIMPKEAGKGDKAGGLPWAQLVLLTAAVLLVSWASLSPSFFYNALGILAAIVLLAVTYVIERKSPNHVLPRDAFNMKKLAPLYITMTLLSLMVTCSEVFIPLFFQTLHAQKPLIAGYLAALMGLGWTLGSLTTSSLSTRTTNRVIVSAPFIGLTGLIVLALLVPGGSQGGWLDLAPMCLSLFMVGYSVGLTWPHLLANVLQITPQNEQGIASASLTTVQLVTTAFGAALAGTIANLAGLSNPGGASGIANAALWLFISLITLPVLAIFMTRIVVRLRKIQAQKPLPKEPVELAA
ncbi:MFS transporter [Paenochrobactrum glaciei]|uniref:MFS transporter n=1 Tax=Paenochrobactrum glaciei TaxID=486407 RepID=A0ABP3QS80_9HYPH